MGASSRQALAAAVDQLSTATGVTIATGAELLAAARAIDGSSQLRGILADPAVESAAKAGLIAQIFPNLEKNASALLGRMVDARWSNGDELVDGIEQVGIRAIAEGDGHTAKVERELFTFARIVSSDPSLELALGSKLADPAGKGAIVDELLAKQAHEGTLAIVDHLVRSPRGRRIGEMLADAGDFVAAAGSRRVATVTSAVALSKDQQKRLSAALAKQYGGDIQLNLVIDPTVVGGARIQLGDDVIDGTISARLANLKLQLAG